ncbi:MAG: lysophospholipid acyltransferase family protein [Isosphaeraceae bacterium]|nr:lysophospholipid acyltransferase family protein [Isosphaeraceae bacterium]
MHRLPLADELPYRFFPPRASRFWLWAGRFYWKGTLLRKQRKVMRIEVEGLDRLRSIVGKGDGVLITPNHCDAADGAVMLDLATRIGSPVCFMAAYQVLLNNGRLGRALLPRMGAFPVDREGTDLRAFKTGVEILSSAKLPLVVFPEGEVYHVSDRLTPIREGAASLAVSAAKKLAEAKRTVWIVPAAIKYRFLDSYDPLPDLARAMDRLESRFTWWPETEASLVARIYRYGEALLGLKELEYHGAVRRGPLHERIARLRDEILDRLEERLGAPRKNETVPVRVKELRRLCIEALSAEDVAPERVRLLRRDLHDLFTVIQLFSYPGDYVREAPTVERAAETLLKFEEDLLGYDDAEPVGPRRAIVRIGEPIDVGAFLATSGKRGASTALTTDLEGRIQALLDAIGPGRPLPFEGDARSPGSLLEPRLGIDAAS